MKKIINGKMYNTETAEFICSYENTWYRSDFCYSGWELYRKKTGEYFFLRETYNKSYILSDCRNTFLTMNLMTTDGEPILSAKTFVEEFGTTEDYERLFGSVEE